MDHPIGNVVQIEQDGKKYYGTVRKVEITEEKTLVYVGFAPTVKWQPFEPGELTNVSIRD